MHRARHALLAAGLSATVPIICFKSKTSSSINRENCESGALANSCLSLVQLATWSCLRPIGTHLLSARHFIGCPTPVQCSFTTATSRVNNGGSDVSPNIELGDPDRPEVVVVTGGAGFLGQHVVRMLQERGTNVKEIRVFDHRPYHNRLGHVERIPVRCIEGDVCVLEDVRGAVRGADSVIHTAGLVSFGTFPNTADMQRVNVRGSANVIQACVEENVPRLVYTSTVDVVIGTQPIADGDESLEVPSPFLFKGYPDTKYRAELLVTAANGRRLAKGDGSAVLNTVCLRPNVMYGELDPYYVTSGLRSAAQNGGKLVCIGNGRALFQQAYAGNVAWAHLCAVAALRREPSAVGGRSYFVTDNTPVVNSFEFMKPFLHSRQFSLSKWAILYPLAYITYYLLDTALAIVRPIREINLSIALPSIVYVNLSVYFSRRLAEELLHYHPVFDYQTSMTNSLPYYQQMNLD